MQRSHIFKFFELANEKTEATFGSLFFIFDGVKNKKLSEIRYQDVFEQPQLYIWDYNTDELTLEAKELIIPRVLQHPASFDQNLDLLEIYYDQHTIYDTLKKTRGFLFEDLLIRVCQRYQKPLFPYLIQRKRFEWE